MPELCDVPIETDPDTRSSRTRRSVSSATTVPYGATTRPKTRPKTRTLAQIAVTARLRAGTANEEEGHAV